MISDDNITAKKLNSIMIQLHENRTILRLNHLGKGYEGLTIVTGFSNGNEKSSFMIDFPGGAGDVFSGSEGGRIFFEFSGEDKLQYTFRTVIEKVMEREIQIRFPDSIDRIQRRRHFRVTSLSGTLVMFQNGRGAYELNVMNISQSGALINQDVRLHDKSLFFTGSILRDINITASDENGGERIKIKRSEVKRVERNSFNGKYQYALHFLDVSKRDDSLIKGYIYRCQREVLKSRSYIAGD